MLEGDEVDVGESEGVDFVGDEGFHGSVCSHCVFHGGIDGVQNQTIDVVGSEIRERRRD